MSDNLVKRVKTGLTTGVLSLVALLASTSSQAAVISENFSALGQLESPGSITWDFTAEEGASLLSFELTGYTSLDGFDNGYTDIFDLILNGNKVFTGSFNLGGGGHNTILFNPNGGLAYTTTFAASDDIYNSTQVTWVGGVSQIELPVYLLTGANQIVFSYSGSAQGLGDESWGINQATLTTIVPEPATYGLLFAGLMGLAAARRRTQKQR